MGMLIADLNTDRGHHVAHVLVPPFSTGYPLVIIWGNRVFLRLGDSKSEMYQEAFAYCALEEWPDAPTRLQL